MSDNSGPEFGVNLSLFGESTFGKAKTQPKKPPKYYFPDCLPAALGQITASKAVQDAIANGRLPYCSIRLLDKVPAEGITSMLHDDLLPVVRKGDSYECLDEFEILGKAKLMLGLEVKVPVSVYPIPNADEQIKFAAIRRAKRVMGHTGDVEVAANLLVDLTASGHLNIRTKVELKDALGVSLSRIADYNLEAKREAAGLKRKRGGKHTKKNNGK